MKKATLLPALAASPIHAQYSDLVTTRDGSRVYFSSALRLRGTSESDAPKIFRYGTAFELFQQPALSGEALSQPQVSADGAVVGYTDGFPGECICGFCLNSPGNPQSGVIASATVPNNPFPSLTGRLRLSRDGKSAMICCGDVALRAEPNLVNLQNGAFLDLKGFDAIGDGQQSLSDLSAGAAIVLLLDKTSTAPVPVLYRNGKTARLHFSYPPIAARMNADAKIIVYESAVSGGQYQLIVHRAGSGAEEVLRAGPPVPLSGENASYFQPWLSDDGSSVLFLDRVSGIQQVFIQDTNGSPARQLTIATNTPEGVSAATLSGDGAVVYASTPDGRMLRVLTASGQVEELAGRTPQLASLAANAVPGSVNWILGAALTNAGVKPKLRIGSLEAPVISASSSLVKFQIPWETVTNQSMEARLEYGSLSPFESVLTIKPATASGDFLNSQQNPMLPPGFAQHQNFLSPVTPTNPALPGEIIHFYMVGLGPVSPPVATGEKTPSSGPLHRVLYPPVFCAATNITDSGTQFLNAPVSFVGLAPGYTGLYQMDLQVPEGLLNADSWLSCGLPVADTGGGYQIAVTHLYTRVQ